MYHHEMHVPSVVIRVYVVVFNCRVAPLWSFAQGGSPVSRVIAETKQKLIGDTNLVRYFSLQV